MICLYIDTTTDYLYAALSNDNALFSEKKIKLEHNLSKDALYEITKMFEEEKLSPDSVDKIIVCNGPGSFTGTRIGVTVGKTLAYSIKKNIIPVSSLKMKVLGLKDNDYYISIIKDRKNYIYYAIYDKEYNEIVKDCYSSIEKLKKDINKLESNYKIICDDDIDLDLKYEKSIFNIKSIVDYYQEKEINSYLIKPNYLKIIEAESKL